MCTRFQLTALRTLNSRTMTGATCPLAADTGEDLDDDDEEDHNDDDVKEHIEDTWQSRDIRGPALQRSHEGGELLVYNIFMYVHTIYQN